MDKMKLSNQNGSTLVECIATFAIFTLAAFILMSGFLTAANLVVESGKVKNNSNKVIDVMETSTAQAGVSVSETSSENFAFKLGNGSQYTVKGSYKTGTCENVRLVSFISNNSGGSSNFIPETNMPVNGVWPPPESFPQTWTWVTVSKGTTLVFDGKYYISAGNLNVGPGFPYPTPTSGWWYNNNTGLIEISSRPVIVWDGGTMTEFYEYTNHHVDMGDKVLWNGRYYVFTISGQTWVDPPNQSLHNWAIVN